MVSGFYDDKANQSRVKFSSCQLSQNQKAITLPKQEGRWLKLLFSTSYSSVDQNTFFIILLVFKLSFN